MKPSLPLSLIVVLACGLLSTAASTRHIAPDPAPPAPANVRASDGTYSYMVKITWNASAGATDYRIFRANSLDGNKTSLALAAATFYEDYSAWGGLQIHYYWVIACVNSMSCTDLDEATPDSGFRGLDTPTVSASDGTYSDKVRINWSSVQSATSYTLYRGTSDAGYNTSIADLTTTSYDDTNALRGTIYYYWVKAVAPIDESHFGGPDTGYRNFAPPSGVTASDGTYTDKVRVTWFGSANASRYQIWRTPTTGGGAVKIGAAASPPFDDPGAAPGVSYAYQIKACTSDESICSQDSSPDNGYRALTAPTGVQASDGTYPDTVRVTWNASAGATFYSVLRALSPAGARTEVATPAVTLCDDTDASPGAPHYYWIKACTTGFCSEPSLSEPGYRSSMTPTPTATRPAATPTATTTRPAATPTATATRNPGRPPRTYLPLVLK